MNEHRSRILRNCSFVFLFLAALFSYSTNMKASEYTTLNDAWSYWGENQYCTIGNSGGDWAVTINCDFPNEEYPNDELTVCAGMGDDLWYTTNNICDNDYLTYLVEEGAWPEDPYPEWCYDVWTSPFSAGCAEDDAYVTAGCQNFNWCVN